MPQDPLQALRDAHSRIQRRQSPLGQLTDFADEQGATVTSTTGGKHNSGSKHYEGRAIDLRTKDRTSQDVDALMQNARQEGYRVIDERQRPAGQKEWGGEHLHLEVDDLTPLRAAHNRITSQPALPESSLPELKTDEEIISPFAFDKSVMQTASEGAAARSAMMSDPLAFGQYVKQARDNVAFQQNRQSGVMRAISQFAQKAATGTARIPQGVAELSDLVNAVPETLAQKLAGVFGVDLPDSPKLAPKLAPYTRKATEAIQEAIPTDQTDESWLTGKIPAALGSTVPFMLGGAASGGSRLVTGLLGAASNVADIGEEFDAAGGDPNKRKLAIASAAAVGLSEVAGMGKLLAKFGANRSLLEAAKTILEEAGQEGFQQWANNLIASDVGAYDPNRPASQGVVEAAKLGAITGGVVSGAGKVANKLGAPIAPEARQDDAVRSIREAWEKRARPDQMPGMPIAASPAVQSEAAETTPEDDILSMLGKPAAKPGDKKGAAKEIAAQKAAQQEQRREQARTATIDEVLARGEQRLEATDTGQWSVAQEAARGEAAELRRLAALESDPVQKQNYQRRAEQVEEQAREFAGQAKMVKHGKAENARLAELQQQSEAKASALAQAPLPETPAEPLANTLPEPSLAQRASATSRSTAEAYATEAQTALTERRFGDARAAYGAQIRALKDLQAGVDRKTPGGRILRSKLERQIQEVSEQRWGVGQQEKLAANKATAELPESKPAISTPLLESITNPEGGIPPVMQPPANFARLAEEQEAGRSEEGGVRLLARIRQLGGVDPAGMTGELQGAVEKRYPGLINRKSGLKPDDLLERLAIDEGYPLDRQNLDTLWSAIDQDVAGKPVYPLARSRTAELQDEEERHYQNLAEWEEAQMRQPTANLPAVPDQQAASTPAVTQGESSAQPITSAYAKLGTDNPRVISALYARADEVYRRSSTPEERAKAQEARDLVGSLTEAERRAVAEVLPANRFSPVKDEDQLNYGRAVQDISNEEVTPQLEANFEDVASFFDEMAKGDKTLSPEEHAAARAQLQGVDELHGETITPEQHRIATGLNVLLTSTKGEAVRFRQLYDKLQNEELPRHEAFALQSIGKAYGIPKKYIEHLVSEGRRRRADAEAASQSVERPVELRREGTTGQEIERAPNAGAKSAQPSLRAAGTPERTGRAAGREARQGVADETARVTRQYMHTDFGTVTESENQQGVADGKVRVVDEQGGEHVIQRPTGGQGNQKAAPVRSQSNVVPLKVAQSPQFTPGQAVTINGKPYTVTEHKPGASQVWAQQEGGMQQAFRVGDVKAVDEPKLVTDARQRIQERLRKGQVSSGVDPANLRDLAITTGYDVYRTAKDFAEWSKEMVKRLGEGVRAHLDSAWQAVSGERKPVFFSQLERVLQDKMPERASREQIQAIVRSPQNGVKPDEVQWIGLDEWLAEHPRVTKAEVLEFVRANQVDVQEVMKGSEYHQDWDDAFSDITRKLESIGEDVGEWGEYDAGAYKDGLTKQEARRIYNTIKDIPDADVTMNETDDGWAVYFEPLDDHPYGETVDSTKFSQYVLPGAQEGSYRELLLTLPFEQQRVDDAVKERIVAHLKVPIYQRPDSNWAMQMLGPHPPGDKSLRPKAVAILQEVTGLSDPIEAVAAFRSVTNQPDQRTIFKSSHFDEPNILAHVRFNDRVDADGARVLFVEELQSDWHQTGKKEGYAVNTTAERQRLEDERKRLSARDANYFPRLREINARLEEIDASVPTDKSVPDAPFKKSWHELAFKRMLRYASENGYDKLAWTTGGQQFQRWGSPEIKWRKQSDGTFLVSAKEQSGGQAGGVDIEGEAARRGILLEGAASVKTQEDLMPLLEQINRGDAEIDGSKVWNRMQSSPEGTYLPRKEFFEFRYDDQLRNFANKYARKWGAKVSETVIGEEKPVYEIVSSGLNTSLKYEVLRDGQPADGGRRALFQNENDARKWIKDKETSWIGEKPLRPTTVHSIDITPAMTGAVMQGQPRFSGIPINLEPTKQAILATFKEGQRIAKTEGKFAATKYAGKEVLDLFRGVTLSGDAPIFRQGAMVTLPPQYWGRAIADMNKARQAWKDVNFAKAKTELETMIAEVGKKPVLIAKLAKQAGVQFSSDLFAKKRAQFEEGQESSIARSLPGFGNLEQMNAIYMDLRRLDVFHRYMDAAMKEPLSNEQIVKTAKDAANAVNLLSGRAAPMMTEVVRDENGKVIEPAREKRNLTNAILHTGSLLWSPKYLVSRMRLLNPRTYTQMSPAVRKALAKDVGAFAGMVLAAGAMAAQAGWSVSLDPDDSDFLKLKTPDGKTRYDIAAGFGPLLRLYWQVAKAGTTLLPEKAEQPVRKVMGIKEKSGQLARDTKNEAERFARGKLSPVPSFIALGLLYDWKEVTGEKVTPGKAVLTRTLPLMYQDFQKAYETGQKENLIKVLPAFAGIGVQQYERKGNKARFEISKQPGEAFALPHGRPVRAAMR